MSSPSCQAISKRFDADVRQLLVADLGPTGKLHKVAVAVKERIDEGEMVQSAQAFSEAWPEAEAKAVVPLLPVEWSMDMFEHLTVEELQYLTSRYAALEEAYVKNGMFNGMVVGARQYEGDIVIGKDDGDIDMVMDISHAVLVPFLASIGECYMSCMTDDDDDDAEDAPSVLHGGDPGQVRRVILSLDQAATKLEERGAWTEQLGTLVKHNVMKELLVIEKQNVMAKLTEALDTTRQAIIRVLELIALTCDGLALEVEVAKLMGASGSLYEKLKGDLWQLTISDESNEVNRAWFLAQLWTKTVTSVLVSTTMVDASDFENDAFKNARATVSGTVATLILLHGAIRPCKLTERLALMERAQSKATLEGLAPLPGVDTFVASIKKKVSVQLGAQAPVKKRIMRKMPEEPASGGDIAGPKPAKLVKLASAEEVGVLADSKDVPEEAVVAVAAEATSVGSSDPPMPVKKTLTKEKKKKKTRLLD